MTTRMLIDARHREETRVAVIKGSRIEEFDFESAEHKQIKGNIYLAKVTRVEPSLQAAFVEYGGNRHGFLAFSEIHPDYYQIPKEDREALIREEAEHAAAAAMRYEDEMDSLEGDIEDVRPPAPLGEDDHHDDDGQDDDIRDERDDAIDEDDDTTSGEGGSNGEGGDGGNGDGTTGRDRGRRGRRRGRSGDQGGDRSAPRDEPMDYHRSLHRRYKIQDVIRRRQVLLVQVVKEERGSKGAALTSYLSLAGRYCVLMPNSSHGGGISRKISNGADRKRLKSVIDELGLPSSMGCIVRTAGLERTKTEIKRDFDYLARLWDEIRDKTLKSAAPALIHSDSDLIKRAIRDIYNSDIEEVSVEGDEGYRAAKDFMKLLMPSHARRVKQYVDPVPLFQRYGVEDQLGAMYQPVVPLKSGGYLVINPTEALVSIDINSGRSTREHNIEQTAYNTNLEAAYEIARQLRLRDMAGLVVIDFIDMEVGGNVRRVEKAMRDALKNDRARIQVGRISGFGLMEMSRQRLRTGVLEASTRSCPHCEGTGLVRTASSAGLSALRLLEEEAARGRGTKLTLRASQEAAFYVLNNKRAELSEIETRYGVTIDVQSDGQTEGARMTVEVSGPPPAHVPRLAPIVDLDDEEEDVIPEFDDEGDEEEQSRQDRGGARSDRDRSDGGERARKRRGRRRRGGRRDDADRPEQPAIEEPAAAAGGSETEDADSAETDAPRSDAGDGSDGARRRRRGRRGGRGRRAGQESRDSEPQGAQEGDDADTAPLPDAAESMDPAGSDEDMAPAKPRRRKKAVGVAVAATDGDAAASTGEAAGIPDEALPAKPARKPRKAKSDGAAADTAAAKAADSSEAAPKPKRASRARKSATAESAATDAGAAESEPAPAIVAVEPAAASLELADAADSPVLVSDTPASGDGTGADENGERRRGWWQRTFGA